MTTDQRLAAGRSVDHAVDWSTSLSTAGTPEYAWVVSDSESTHTGPPEPTLAEVIARAEPIGDLSRFVIDDLTEDDEDEFFGILADL